MSRPSPTAYRRQVLVLMSIYTALMLLEWPLVRAEGTGPVLRIVLALVPPLPVLGVLWVAARRFMQSDELEQRVHLLALSIATGVVCALSITVGFLCAANVLALGGDLLIFVFPALIVVYVLVRWPIARRYGTEVLE